MHYLLPLVLTFSVKWRQLYQLTEIHGKAEVIKEIYHKKNYQKVLETEYTCVATRVRIVIDSNESHDFIRNINKKLAKRVRNFAFPEL